MKSEEWLGTDYYDFTDIFINREPTAGQILKALRILCGYEQKELAERIGVKQAAISKWENNISEPGTENLKPLAKSLCISVDALLEFLCHPIGREYHPETGEAIDPNEWKKQKTPK